MVASAVASAVFAAEADRAGLGGDAGLQQPHSLLRRKEAPPQAPPTPLSPQEQGRTWELGRLFCIYSSSL